MVSFDPKLRGSALRTFSYAVVFCASLSIMAPAQTKAPSVAPAKRPAANAARTIPAIKCVDHDTAPACKSFKELVDAHDERLLNAVWGQPGHNSRHTSYVCLRKQDDTFSVIEFDIPELKEFRPPFNEHYEEMARSPNASLRESVEPNKKLFEDSVFEDFSDPPAVSQYTKEQWFQNHSKDFVYALAFVADSVYQDGLDKGTMMETGEWSTWAGSGGSKQHDPSTWFTGTYAWIERFNREHGNVSAKDDDPEHAHISVDLSSVKVHFNYENPSRDTVDYTMQINRLTGRFIEYFKFPSGSDENYGTCMIFK